MVLDGEEDESLRILLEEGLIGLLGLNGVGNSRLGGLFCSLHLGDDGLGHGLGGDFFGWRVVLLVGDAEVKLLDRRLHLQVANGRSSLDDPKY
jgi:hypothetical protein